jgi:uncharacterized protein (TIGR03435 family)
MRAAKESFLRIVTIAALGLLVPLANLGTSQLYSQTVKTKASPATQQKAMFEVVSIKPSNSDRGTQLRRQPGGLYRATNVTARALMASAYQGEFPPKGERIFGGPGWIDSEHFDIEARAAGDPTREQDNLMLQSLLEDRFKLVLHHEMRQLPVYALVIAKPGKTGPQLVSHSDAAKCTEPLAGTPPSQPRPEEPMPAFCGGFFMSRGNGALRESGNRITMDMLAQFVDQSVDRSVVDRTGLTGTFDFTLEFAPEVGPGYQPGSTAEASDASGVPRIFSALQEQLGLKLEPQKAPLDVLVIDHVEEPSPN